MTDTNVTARSPRPSCDPKSKGDLLPTTEGTAAEMPAVYQFSTSALAPIEIHVVPRSTEYCKCAPSATVKEKNMAFTNASLGVVPQFETYDGTLGSNGSEIKVRGVEKTILAESVRK